MAPMEKLDSTVCTSHDLYRYDVNTLPSFNTPYLTVIVYFSLGV